MEAWRTVIRCWEALSPLHRLLLFFWVLPLPSWWDRWETAAQRKSTTRFTIQEQAQLLGGVRQAGPCAWSCLCCEVCSSEEGCAVFDLLVLFCLELSLRWLLRSIITYRDHEVGCLLMAPAWWGCVICSLSHHHWNPLFYDYWLFSWGNVFAYNKILA